jgi:ribokinase
MESRMTRNCQVRFENTARAVRWAAVQGQQGPPRVVVVGSLNMDLIVRVPRLPGPGETVLGESLVQAAGGKGANQAVAAARLGASVAIVGRVGRDAFGRELAAGLRSERISTRHVRTSGAPTGTALIEVDAHGENSIAVAPGANATVLPADVPPHVVASAEVVVAQLEVPLATVEAAFRLAREAGVRTLLNAAPAQRVALDLLRLCDVVVLNEHELAALHGQPVRAGEEVTAAQAVRCTRSQMVVVTLGARGAVAVVGDDVVRQSAFDVPVVDSVGAGDAFVAGFVVGRWWSAGAAAALRLGCAAGSLATTREGAQPSLPRLEEVEALSALARDDAPG